MRLRTPFVRTIPLMTTVSSRREASRKTTVNRSEKNTVVHAMVEALLAYTSSVGR